MASTTCKAPRIRCWVAYVVATALLVSPAVVGAGIAGDDDLAQLAAMSPQELVQAIASGSAGDLQPLWSFDRQVSRVVAADVLKGVAERIERESKRVSANAPSLKRLCYYLQIAYYHEFYQESLAYDADLTERINRALATVSSQSAFFGKQRPVQQLRQQWSTTIDSTGGLFVAMNAFDTLVDRYLRAKPSAKGEYRGDVNRLLYSLDRQLSIHLGQQESPWSESTTSGSIDRMGRLAFGSDQELSDKAIIVLGRLSRANQEASQRAHQKLSEILDRSKRAPGRLLAASQALARHYGGKTAKGASVDLDKIKQQVKSTLFPHRFEYEGGQIVFLTALSRQKADELYESIKEVREAFFKVCPFDKPVRNDPNPTITFVIHASPVDYKRYQPLLYNLNTNNGGIYIEQNGQLYTYDRRTPEQSIFTLEELLRHEYVHYLDGRYVIVGGFNQRGTLYQQLPIAWYIEGLAECLAGAGPDGTILPRRKMLRDVMRGKHPMSVPEIVSSGYDKGFSFYQDAGVLFTYLALHEPQRIAELMRGIRTNDVGKAKQAFAKLAEDTQLHKAFDDYRDQLIQQAEEGESGFFEDTRR